MLTCYLAFQFVSYHAHNVPQQKKGTALIQGLLLLAQGSACPARGLRTRSQDTCFSDIKKTELNVNSGFETYEKHRNTSCNQSNTNLPKTSMKYLDRKIKLYLLKIFIFLLNHDTESIYPNLLVSKLEKYRAISAILFSRKFLDLLMLDIDENTMPIWKPAFKNYRHFLIYSYPNINKN